MARSILRSTSRPLSCWSELTSSSSRHVLQRGGDLGHPVVEVLQRVGLDGVLVIAIALAAAGADAAAADCRNSRAPATLSSLGRRRSITSAVVQAALAPAASG